MNERGYLQKIDEVIAQGPYTDTWDSLCEHPTPKWYEKGKFGIFIHWGVYSVPAFGNEWYPRNMYKKGSSENLHHVKKYGTLDKFGYKDFIPMFKAEKFDPSQWAELFKEAGAQFVVPVAEHHDGFKMYASELGSWNSAEMGPMRDVLGELKTEIEERNMVLGASTHRAEQWGVEVAIDAKFDAYVHGSAVKDLERGQLDHITPDLWQNDTSVARNSWGYTEGNDYKKPSDIVLDLVDVVSKNGALLLNIGPKPDGTIPAEDTQILREIGKWLKVNGEAIYGTRYWKVFGEGPTVVPEGHFTDTYEKKFTSEDIRFTSRGNHIYATVLHWPENGEIHIKSLGNHMKFLKSSIKDVELLGTDLHPAFDRTETLNIFCGKVIEPGDMPVVLKIIIE